MNKIEIPFSKTKLLFGLCISILFVVVGFYLVSSSPGGEKRVNPINIKILGLVSVLLLGRAVFYFVKKMFDKTIALTIDDYGVHDNTHPLSVGLIKWEDIVEIKTQQFGVTRVLLIYTSNPANYRNMLKGYKKRTMEILDRIFGTSFLISITFLQYSSGELEKLVCDRLIEHRGRNMSE